MKTHDQDNKVTLAFSNTLQVNIKHLQGLFEGCFDYIDRRLEIGSAVKMHVYLAYIDNMVDRELLEDNIIKNLLFYMDQLPATGQFEYIRENALQTADIKEVTTIEDVTQGIMGGDVMLLVDGYNKAFNISLKDFPGRGVPQVESEVTIKGPKDAFTESVALNTVLIRRRIKDTHLKTEMMSVGIRSQTPIVVSYITDVVKPGLVGQIKEKLNSFVIDGVFDVGMLEELTEKAWYSPFPQYQATERPDKAASALMEGRVALIVDNSPMVLLLPVTMSTFFQASDDYYRNFETASFVRILRYIGAFMAVSLPGLYIAVSNFQPELIPTNLVLSFAAARHGVPFSVFLEVIILMIAFEMLTEAGIRLPSPMGNTIGVVGGLIIGDAAISANLVSPMVVIVVAFTAIASFTIPNETFSSAFRLVRYLHIFLCGFLGLLGFVIGVLLLLIHLASLKSFGIPYLSPFVTRDLERENPLSDSILRFPIFKLRHRPLYARDDEKLKFFRKDKSEEK